jgi:hypothetical protein
MPSPFLGLCRGNPTVFCTFLKRYGIVGGVWWLFEEVLPEKDANWHNKTI